MRYDYGVAINRIGLLESVVDLILGPEAGGNHAVDIIEEDDIRFFANQLSFGLSYYPILIDEIISQGIKDWNTILFCQEMFSDREVALIREEFLERFIKRIKRYSRGRRLEMKDFGKNGVGFRWA